MVVPVSTSVASIEQSGDAVRIAENTYITKKHKLEIPENILKKHLLSLFWITNAQSKLRSPLII